MRLALRPVLSFPRSVPKWHVIVLGTAVGAYIVLHFLQTYSTYLAGRSLFDLAVYEQGFWNALGNPPFFYSPEGDMSRFGRHFSPIFYLILPFYLVYSSPLVLLLAQSGAIGLGALPLYRLAKVRFGSAFGVMLAIAYLLNPAVHDINVKNDFHEIAFALPCLLFLIYLSEQNSNFWYFAGLLLALSTREEVAVATAALGIYLVVFGRRRWRGMVTIAVSLVWFLVVFGYVMPHYNTTGVFPLPEGYDYLGSSIPGILHGILLHPGLVIREATRAPKLAYLFWVYAPLAFVSLLAPEVILIPLIPMLEILLSTWPYHYEIFERYAAPIMPFVFYAFLIGVDRLTRIRLRPGVGPRPLQIMVVALIATLASQAVLHKIPFPIDPRPDPVMARSLALAEALPNDAAVVASDHRWLAHLAHRRYLYPLSTISPPADFVLFDQAHAPVTNILPADLRQAENRALTDPTYDLLQCNDGLTLLGARNDKVRSAVLPHATVAEDQATHQFADGLVLAAPIHEEFRAGTAATIQLGWTAMTSGHADYHVFVHLVDLVAGGKIVAQHDGVPGSGWCQTEFWTMRSSVVDTHGIDIPANLPPAAYELRIGLYDFATLRRLPLLNANQQPMGDYVAIPVTVSP